MHNSRRTCPGVSRVPLHSKTLFLTALYLEDQSHDSDHCSARVGAFVLNNTVGLR